jgi:hypothetical protein
MSAYNPDKTVPTTEKYADGWNRIWGSFMKKFQMPPIYIDERYCNGCDMVTSEERPGTLLHYCRGKFFLKYDYSKQRVIRPENCPLVEIVESTNESI